MLDNIKTATLTKNQDVSKSNIEFFDKKINEYSNDQFSEHEEKKYHSYIDEFIGDKRKSLIDANEAIVYNKFEYSRPFDDEEGDCFLEKAWASKALDEAAKLLISKESPYFARMDFKILESHKPIYIKMYIGKESIVNGETQLVYDWRTPICENYYKKNQTKFTVNGYKWDLLLRRTINIRYEFYENYNNEFIYNSFEYDGITDPFLIQVLKEKQKEKQPTDIIKSIQSNQNDIIRNNLQTNIIVQGCAGSGKTMVLLHRLSYLLYNNTQLKKDSIKIISPNSLFDFQINNLANELELDKIKRGTIEEYYLEKLKIYSVFDTNYNIDYIIGDNKKQFDYYYSQPFIDKLTDAYVKWHRIILKNAKALRIFEIAKIFKIQETRALSSFEQLSELRRLCLEIAIKHEELTVKIIDEYIKNIPNNMVLPAIKDFKNLTFFLEKHDSNNTLTSEEINKLKEICNWDSTNKEDLRLIIDKVNYILYYITKYCNNNVPLTLKKLGEIIKKNHPNYGVNRRDPYSLAYDYIRKIRGLSIICEQEKTKKMNLLRFFIKSYEISKLYDYSKVEITRTKHFMEFEKSISILLEKWIDGTKLNSISEFAQSLPNNLLFLNSQIYLPIREQNKLDPGFNVSSNKYFRFELHALLQLAYFCKGSLTICDTFINIDEGQDISLLEYQLLDSINNHKTTFNIYGDVNQLINGKRGVDDWTKLSMMNFEIYTLKEDYRNTKEITEYCNKKFGYSTLAMGLSGGKVTEIYSFLELKKLMANFALSTEIRKAVIVKDAQTLGNSCLYEIFNKYSINYVMTNNSKISDNKINVFSVAMAKGLEFSDVLVVDIGMSKNEKYISSTRALNYLIYCCFEKELETKDTNWADGEN
jgi:DNA helicase IV